MAPAELAVHMALGQGSPPVAEEDCGAGGPAVGHCGPAYTPAPPPPPSAVMVGGGGYTGDTGYGRCIGLPRSEFVVPQDSHFEDVGISVLPLDGADAPWDGPVLWGLSVTAPEAPGRTTGVARRKDRGHVQRATPAAIARGMARRRGPFAVRRRSPCPGPGSQGRSAPHRKDKKGVAQSTRSCTNFNSRAADTSAEELRRRAAWHRQGGGGGLPCAAGARGARGPM